MFKFKVDLQVRGDEWGVSIGAGKVVGMNDNLGDNKTLRFLIDNGCVNPDHYEEIIESAVHAWTPPQDDDEPEHEE
jgi:hypothetical protein